MAAHTHHINASFTETLSFDLARQLQYCTDRSNDQFVSVNDFSINCLISHKIISEEIAEEQSALSRFHELKNYKQKGFIARIILAIGLFVVGIMNMVAGIIKNMPIFFPLIVTAGLIGMAAWFFRYAEPYRREIKELDKKITEVQRNLMSDKETMMKCFKI